MIDQHNEITVVIKFFEDEADLCFEVPGNTISELFYQHYVKHCHLKVHSADLKISLYVLIHIKIMS